MSASLTISNIYQPFDYFLRNVDNNHKNEIVLLLSTHFASVWLCFVRCN